MAANAESGLTEEKSNADFDPRALHAYLRSRGLCKGVDFSVRRLQGGQSNPTYEIRSGTDRLVLRKKPPGKLLPSAHAVDREFRIMTALRMLDIPVPETECYCEDPSIVGTSFYIMRFVEGRIFLDPALPELTVPERRAIYNEMNGVIARLHQADYASAGLADFGKPGNYFARQIARWSRQYRESALEPISDMDALMDWLPGHIPGGDETCVVHGDYRIDNLVFHPSEPRVIAILDWELATLGHPLADFSYHCMSWHIPASLWRGLGGLDLASLGIPGEAEYVEMYRRNTRQAPIENWDFYIAYNLFRLAAILQGVLRRAHDGNASAENAFEMGSKARPLAELGWAMVRASSVE